MGYLLAFTLCVLLAFVVGGPLLAKKFVHRLFNGNEVYVFLTVDGQTVCDKKQQ